MPVPSLAAACFPVDAVPMATRQLLHALNTGGIITRYAGGAVRDALLKLPAGDVDFATTASPDDVMQRAQTAGWRAVPTGLSHGTVTALKNGEQVEITTLRRDTYTDGRHAVVAFTDDWHLDAMRRDFTINALYADASGTVYDYVGGLNDLAPRPVLRFVGDAARRVAEDYLRILRYYRFVARFNDIMPPFNAEARAACRSNIAGIDQLSGERITSEMLKILSAARPAASLNIMHEDGVLKALSLNAKPQVIRGLDALSPDDRLAALLLESDKVAVFKRWRLTKKQQTAAMRLITTIKKLAANPCQTEVYTALYHLPDYRPERLSQLCSLLIPETPLNAAWWQGVEGARAMPHITPMLLARGLSGAALGEALKEAEQKWVASGFRSPL